MNNKNKRMNRLNFLFLGVLIFMQSCKPSNNNVTKSKEEIVAEEDMDDMSILFSIIIMRDGDLYRYPY